MNFNDAKHRLLDPQQLKLLEYDEIFQSLPRYNQAERKELLTSIARRKEISTDYDFGLFEFLRETNKLFKHHQEPIFEALRTNCQSNGKTWLNDALSLDHVVNPKEKCEEHSRNSYEFKKFLMVAALTTQQSSTQKLIRDQSKLLYREQTIDVFTDLGRNRHTSQSDLDKLQQDAKNYFSGIDHDSLLKPMNDAIAANRQPQPLSWQDCNDELKNLDALSLNEKFEVLMTIASQPFITNDPPNLFLLFREANKLNSQHRKPIMQQISKNARKYHSIWLLQALSLDDAKNPKKVCEEQSKSPLFNDFLIAAAFTAKEPSTHAAILEQAKLLDVGFSANVFSALANNPTIVEDELDVLMNDARKYIQGSEQNILLAPIEAEIARKKQLPPNVALTGFTSVHHIIADIQQNDSHISNEMIGRFLNILEQSGLAAAHKIDSHVISYRASDNLTVQAPKTISPFVFAWQCPHRIQEHIEKIRAFVTEMVIPKGNPIDKLFHEKLMPMLDNISSTMPKVDIALSVEHYLKKISNDFVDFKKTDPKSTDIRYKLLTDIGLQIDKINNAIQQPTHLPDRQSKTEPRSNSPHKKR